MEQGEEESSRQYGLNEREHRLAEKEILKVLTDKRVISMDSCAATNAGT
jgi:hypothetical protein